MSTYIDVAHPNRHAPYTDIPDLVMDYLHYLDVVKLRSPRTINGYYLDLRGFFRYDDGLEPCAARYTAGRN